jgi:hypothetical protein
MRLKKLRKILGDNIYYMVGIDGDYAGNYTRKQLKQFNDLYVISIWTLTDRPGAVCLDLITEDKRG